MSVFPPCCGNEGSKEDKEVSSDWITELIYGGQWRVTRPCRGLFRSDNEAFVVLGRCRGKGEKSTADSELARSHLIIFSSV